MVVCFADSPFHDQPASARSLPADNLPPFSMLDESGHLIPTPEIPAAQLTRGRGMAPESTAPGPRLEEAIRGAVAAVGACARNGFRVGASVVDVKGEARAMLTADGADGSHVFVAIRKALVAIAFRSSSAAAKSTILQNPSLVSQVTPAMFVEGGALPIITNGELIGAIGVSGAAGAPIGRQDELCAQAGLDRIRQASN
jgi:uncharacterized protein GlcG (DUF336 family)